MIYVLLGAIAVISIWTVLDQRAAERRRIRRAVDSTLKAYSLPAAWAEGVVASVMAKGAESDDAIATAVHAEISARAHR